MIKSLLVLFVYLVILFVLVIGSGIKLLGWAETKKLAKEGFEEYFLVDLFKRKPKSQQKVDKSV